MDLSKIFRKSEVFFAKRSELAGARHASPFFAWDASGREQGVDFNHSDGPSRGAQYPFSLLLAQ